MARGLLKAARQTIEEEEERIRNLSTVDISESELIKMGFEEVGSSHPRRFCSLSAHSFLAPTQMRSRAAWSWEREVQLRAEFRAGIFGNVAASGGFNQRIEQQRQLENAERKAVRQKAAQHERHAAIRHRRNKESQADGAAIRGRAFREAELSAEAAERNAMNAEDFRSRRCVTSE